MMTTGYTPEAWTELLDAVSEEKGKETTKMEMELVSLHISLIDIPTLVDDELEERPSVMFEIITIGNDGTRRRQRAVCNVGGDEFDPQDLPEIVRSELDYLIRSAIETHADAA